MKKSGLSIGFILLFTLLLPGQNFISPDKSWSVKVEAFPSGIGTERYKIAGDTVINNIEYQVIWFTMDSTNNNWTFDGLLREEPGIVYYTPPFGTEGILYDFTLEIGDIIYAKCRFCDEANAMTVTAIDTVEYFGVERKRWHFNGEYEEYWIEGIGNLFGPLHNRYYECIICPEWNLLCYHEEQELLYILDGEELCFLIDVWVSTNLAGPSFQIAPNPVAGGKALSVETKNTPERVRLLDARGLPSIQEILYPGTRFQIPMDKLEPGTYFLILEFVDFPSSSQKVIVF